MPMATSMKPVRDTLTLGRSGQQRLVVTPIRMGSSDSGASMESTLLRPALVQGRFSNLLCSIGLMSLLLNPLSWKFCYLYKHRPMLPLL